MTFPTKRVLPSADFTIKLPQTWEKQTDVKDCLEQILAKLCEEKPAPSIEECCTGGASEAVAMCYRISASLMTPADADCVYTFNGVELPPDHTIDDVLATLPAGSTIVEDAADPLFLIVCSSVGERLCYSSQCIAEGSPIFGTLARQCVIGTPNTIEPECANFTRVHTKFEEPIANLIATQNQLLEDILHKVCEMESDRLTVLETVCY